MNENDLSDEAFWKWDEQFKRWNMDQSFSQHALMGFQEAIRRAKANPWQFLDEHRLGAIRLSLSEFGFVALTEEVDAELERRKAK